MILEQEYKNIDFTQFSKVKEDLRQRLHQVRRQEMAPVTVSLINSGFKQELDWQQMDYVIAAGNHPAKNDDWED